MSPKKLTDFTTKLDYWVSQQQGGGLEPMNDNSGVEDEFPL